MATLSSGMANRTLTGFILSIPLKNSAIVSRNHGLMPV